MVRNNSKPRMCNLSITLSCMLKCIICYHWQRDESGIRRPGLKEWKKFIDSFQGQVNSDFILVFGGGEPLLFPRELLELISFSSRLGFRTALATSGHTINEELARQLAESGLNNIDLSIFSLNNRVHDYVRGVDGSLERVLRAIDYLSRFKETLKIGINTIIMRPSLDDLLTLTEWVNNDSRLLGINYQVIMRPFHTPFIGEWYRTEEYRHLWPDEPEKFLSVIDNIIALKQKGYRIANSISQFVTFKNFLGNPSNFVKSFACNLAGGSFFTINSDGNVGLCPYLESLGNITQGSFPQLWHSEHAERIKEKIDRCKTNCHHLINCWYEEEPNEQK